MRNIPERIFLNIQEECMDEFENFEELVRVGGVTWSEHNIYEADVEYIRKRSPWIGTNERLPNEDEIVLCRMKSNGAIVSGYVFISPDNLPCVSTSPDFEFEDYGGYVLDMWMPIPEFNK